jgi:hypothetical protein
MNHLSTSFDVRRVIHFQHVSLKSIRIERLKQLQRERGMPGPVEFGAMIGKKPNQISDLLTGRASFGEKVARGIEEKAGKAPLWLDQAVEDGGQSGQRGAWPLAGILTPDEWARLPEDARAAVLQGAEFVLAPYLAKLRLGKSSPSRSGDNPRRFA